MSEPDLVSPRIAGVLGRWLAVVGLVCAATGCGLAVETATPPTSPASTVPTGGAGATPSAGATPPPVGDLETTTPAIEGLVETPPPTGPSLDELETSIDASGTPFCTAANSLVYFGASAANIGSTTTTRQEVLTRDQQAAAIAYIGRASEAGRRLVELAGDDLTPEESAVILGTMDALDQAAAAEPADGDARTAFERVFEEQTPLLAPMYRLIFRDCPDSAIGMFMPAPEGG